MFRSIITVRYDFEYTHPDNDAHALALWGKGEDLQDVEGQNLSCWSLQLQRTQVSVDQSQTNTLCPAYQGHLQHANKSQ